MIKIIGIVLTALIINIVLKNYSREFTLFVNLVCAVIIFSIIANDLKSIIDKMVSLTDSVSVISPYIKIMLKILGISMLAQLLSYLCRDNVLITLANHTVLSAKILLLFTSLPPFTAIINIMTGMLK